MPGTPGRRPVSKRTSSESGTAFDVGADDQRQIVGGVTPPHRSEFEETARLQLPGGRCVEQVVEVRGRDRPWSVRRVDGTRHDAPVPGLVMSIGQRLGCHPGDRPAGEDGVAEREALEQHGIGAHDVQVQRGGQAIGLVVARVAPHLLQTQHVRVDAADRVDDRRDAARAVRSATTDSNSSRVTPSPTF